VQQPKTNAAKHTKLKICKVKKMKIVLLFITVLFSSAVGTAQQQRSAWPGKQERAEKKSSVYAREPHSVQVYYGGYFTMNFSKNYSVVGAQPLIAYKLTPQLSFGTQLSFEYINDNRYSVNQNGSNYGASIFSRYRLTPYFYTHTELSLMNYKWFYTDGSDERKLAPMLYLGGGFSQPVSENTWINAQVLFDVLNHRNSPYKKWEPYYSIGFGVGF
jgi:hypothetical protein